MHSIASYTLSYRSVDATKKIKIDVFLTGEHDARGRVAGAHLGLRSLQRREEYGEDERRFGESHSRRHIARHPEVRILIDGAGNQATDILAPVEDEGERTAA